MRIFLHTTRTATLLSLVAMVVSLLYPIAPVAALIDEQKRAFDLGAGHYDHEIIDAETSSKGGGVSQTGNLAGACHAEQIWNFLLGKEVQGTKLTPQLVAGIMGNMQAESGFFPNRVQGQPPEKGSDNADISGGYGIVQWTPGRKIIPEFDRLKPAFANEDPPLSQHSDLRFQLTLLLDQLNGIGGLQESDAGQDLVRHKTNVREAAKSFMTKYERPKNQSAEHQEDRADLADGVFNTGTSGQWDCHGQGSVSGEGGGGSF